jgi:hypothetical protein
LNLIVSCSATSAELAGALTACSASSCEPVELTIERPLELVIDCAEDETTKELDCFQDVSVRTLNELKYGFLLVKTLILIQIRLWLLLISLC